MVITYSAKSAPTAFTLADMDENIAIKRSSIGDINWGKRVSNTMLNSDTSNVTNKRIMRELFAANNVPMPRLYELGEILGMLDSGFAVDIVGRPDHHSKGRGFWRIRNHSELRRALRGTRRKMAATHFMGFVNAPREYRVHVFLGKSIRISEKRFGETGLTARGDYVTYKPQHNVDHVREAAKTAVAAVGLDFGAVDVLANDSECWVLEVNSAPALGGSLPRLYAKKFAKWYEEQA